MRPMRPHALGDSHNFGRSVTRRGRWIHKPRPLVWEWLVLAAESPLRRALARAAASEGVPEAFAFLPDLEFVRPWSRDRATVSRISLRPLPRLSRSRKHELATIVGRSLALFAWLGVADLHWENLALGLGRRGQIVFAPLDVEMILDELSLPTETKLIPDADPEVAAICRHAAGVRRVLPFLGKPVSADAVVAIAFGYASTLALLERHRAALAAVFARVLARAELPIRVCLRGTDEYVRARTEPVWPPLLDAESEQLARGDIPYFFRLVGRPGIFWYAEKTLREIARLPLRGDVPRLAPLLSIKRELRSAARAKLRDEGLFTVIGAFDHQALRGRHETDGLALTFGARELVIELGGAELRSPRDLRAFVGSVYLPCRCGEVRGVLVPKVTSCALAL